MALETLKDVTNIDGFEVERIVDFDLELEGHITKEAVNKVGVAIHDKSNTIVFKIQNGPIKENGVNGCQVDTLIAVAKQMLLKLNENFASHYNTSAIAHLEGAYNALKARKLDREKRGVEGYNKE